MKSLLLLFLCSFTLGAQVQIGGGINGGAFGDRSGTSVSMSLNGERIAIGSPRSNGGGLFEGGETRIYQKTNDTWLQVGDGIYGDDILEESGFALSISSDGSSVVIGSPKYYTFGEDAPGDSPGQVRVFDDINGEWVQSGLAIRGTTSDGWLGTSVDISADGNRIIVGEPFSLGFRGRVYIYERTGASWTPVGAPILGEGSSDLSGTAVSISDSGTRVAIGANRNDGNGSNSGHIRIYEETNGSWNQVGNDIDGEGVDNELGYSVSLSADGTRVVGGAPFAERTGFNWKGHFRIFEELGGSWTQVGTSVAGIGADDRLGVSVSISSDGTTVGASGNFVQGVTSGPGYTRIYRESGNNWLQVGTDIVGEEPMEESGRSVSLSGDGNFVAIGAPRNNSFTGQVRVYDLTSILPITLRTFTAIPNQKQALLYWQTASETSNVGFHLQHSTNGQTWTTLDFFPGAGDSQTERHYEYTHPNPAPGANFYRLEQEDFDGTKTLSKVVTVHFDGAHEMAITPNPASKKIFVSSDRLTERTDYQLTVFDATGRQLMQVRNTNELDVTQFPQGVYSVVLRVQGKTVAKRFVRR